MILFILKWLLYAGLAVFGVLMVLGVYYYVAMGIAAVYFFFFVIIASFLVVTTWPITLLFRCFGIKMPYAYRLFVWQFAGYQRRYRERYPDVLPDGRYSWESHEEFSQRVYNEWLQQKQESDTASNSSSGNSNGQGASPPVEESFDPWKVLEIPPGTPKAVITRVYRQKMMKTHPDKVATLDSALQEFATERAKLLQKAYSAAMSR